MGNMVQNKFEFLMDQLGVANTVHLTAAHVKPVKVNKPMPEALQAATK